MPTEPARKKTFTFFDGQNLFYAAKEAFGYTYPNYDPLALAQAVCKARGWDLVQTRFYTGIPDRKDDLKWNFFWTKKLASMGKRGIIAFSRSLRYRNQTIKCPTGTITALVGQEKGVDVRLALDVVRAAMRRDYDVALIFSQDQDLSEAAAEIREIARLQGRWLKIACAFPLSPTSRNTRGIDKTDWIIIDRALYDACLDPNDYRPKKQPGQKP
jgi:uncharacterized LabA/DUF88 family protein